MGPTWVLLTPEGPMNLAIGDLFRNRDSHHLDKMVERPSYLYKGNPYAGKMVPLCWNNPLEVFQCEDINIAVEEIHL